MCIAQISVSSQYNTLLLLFHPLGLSLDFVQGAAAVLPCDCKGLGTGWLGPNGPLEFDIPSPPGGGIAVF